MRHDLGASLREQAGRASPRACKQSRPSGDHPSRGGPKIRLFINHDHVALVLRVKRALCVGEEVRAA